MILVAVGLVLYGLLMPFTWFAIVVAFAIFVGIVKRCQVFADPE